MLKQKKLHGKFFNKIEEVAGGEMAMVKRDGSIKRETESLMITAQEQAIRIKAIKARIDKTQVEGKCRLCDSMDETVRYMPYVATKGV